MTKTLNIGRPLKSARQLSKQLVLQTALPIVQKNGADNLSFRLLAEKLNVTPMAVKYHAGSKRDLLASFVELAFKDMLEEDVGRSAKNKIRNLLSAYHKRASINANLLRAVLNDTELMSNDLIEITNTLQACTRELNNGDQDSVLMHLLIDYTHGFVLSSSSDENKHLTIENYLRGVDWVLESAEHRSQPGLPY